MFEGFSAERPEFLWGLALNNEKPWFEAHREQYERCLHRPFRALAFQLADEMERLHPGDAPALHISRIHRDARRLFGRGPYKDHLWFTLAKTSGLHDVQPCLWFEIGATNCSYGLGFWMQGEMSRRWRAQINANPEALVRLVRKFNRQDRFTLGGEQYKRPKGDPGKLLFDWYNSRWLSFEEKIWFEPDPPGPELAERVLSGYELLLPLYRYMAKII